MRHGTPESSWWSFETFLLLELKRSKISAALDGIKEIFSVQAYLIRVIASGGLKGRKDKKTERNVKMFSEFFCITRNTFLTEYSNILPE